MNKLLRDPKYLYTLKFDPSGNGQKLVVDGYEKEIEMPVAPADALCRNYGLPLDEQKFRRDAFPANWKNLDPEFKDAYVEQMFHLRRNGEWWWIKGQKLYIPGGAWVFFNYWHTAAGPLPDFRLSALELFWIWYLSVLPDPDCLGLFDLKPRRIGDTENFLFIGWEMVTAYRGSEMGSMANDDKKAQKNFKRIVRANRLMVPPFRPINKGTDKSEKALEFTYPAEYLTKKNLLKEVQSTPEYPPLESKIDYMASAVGMYDGERLRYFLYDETGKIAKYNFAEQMDVVIPTMTLFNNKVVVGKAALPTTVEDYKEGRIVEWISEYWRNSDPNMPRDEYGRTATGLYRVFRSARISAECDEWGFPDPLAEQKILAQRKYLEDQKLFKKLEKYKRQFPLFIEDALSLPSTECPLLPHLLDAQIKNILLGQDWKGNKVESWSTRGNLTWTSGFGSAVKWEPSPTGRWEIAEHPEKPNNMIYTEGRLMPGNKPAYQAGIDPLDEGKKSDTTSTREAQLSQMAIVVKRKFNPMIDNEKTGIIYNVDEETGLKYIANPEALKTGKLVCFYKFRPDTPFDGFADMIKTLIYYGCVGFMETNRVYYRNLCQEKGFTHFLSTKPRQLLANPGMKNPTEIGSKSTPMLINLYVDSLINYIAQYWMTIPFLGLLQDSRKFNGQNQSKCDGTVAWGFEELLEFDPRLTPKEESSDGWAKLPWQTYKRS